MPLFFPPAGNPEQVPRRLLTSMMDMAGFTLCGLVAFQLRFDGSYPLSTLMECGRRSLYGR